MHTDAADVGFGGKFDVAGNTGDPGQWQNQGIWKWKDVAECILVRYYAARTNVVADTKVLQVP
jgi:hypothetical protein